VVLVLWLASGVYIVQPGEAVVGFRGVHCAARRGRCSPYVW
jgi:hypothetical protein